MTVKAHEDKTFRGAFIASLTLPWGFAVNADEGGGGYHFVWARDLYHQVTGLLAAGDRAAGDRAVDWLFEHQQQADGTFPQNSRVDGTPDQRNIQLDETAFPIVLAYQLARTDDRTWEGVRKAADALVRIGPVDAAGALGGDRRLLALDHGGGDRRPGRRRQDRPLARRPRPRAAVARRRRRVAAQHRGVDVHDDRALRRRALLPAHRRRHRPRRRRRARLGQRRRRAPREGGRRRRLPGARAARRQGARRPVRGRLAARDRRVAGHRHAERPRLAPLHASTATARRPPASRGRSTRPARRAARGRCSAASAASTRSPTAATGSRTCGRWPTRPTRAT